MVAWDGGACDGEGWGCRAGSHIAWGGTGRKEEDFSSSERKGTGLGGDAQKVPEKQLDDPLRDPPGAGPPLTTQCGRTDLCHRSHPARSLVFAERGLRARFCSWSRAQDILDTAGSKVREPRG